MTVQNPNELARVHRFALKCYGWDLNSTEVAIVQKIARFGIKAAPIVNGGGIRKVNTYRVLKQIGIGYRDVMDY